MQPAVYMQDMLRFCMFFYSVKYQRFHGLLNSTILPLILS